MADIWEIVGALGGYSAVIAGLFKFYSDRRYKQIEDLSGKFSNQLNEIRDEFDKRILQSFTQNEMAMKALAAQVRAIETDIAKEYIRRPDLDVMVSQFRADLHGMRQDFSEVRKMLFDIMRDMERPR